MKLVKTHVRNTMSHERLNHCVLVHNYADLVNGFDDREIMQDFVSNDRQSSVSGKI